MKRSLAVLLIGFVTLTSVSADEKDDWTGEWVLPRQQKVPFRDADGKPLGAWFASAGKVLLTGKTHLQVQQSQGPGPFEGYVSKTDVVKLADAVAFFSDRIRADGKSAWAWRMRAEAWMLKEEFDSAIKDLTEAIRLDPQFTFAFCRRGVAWDAQKEYDKAIKDYTEAIRLDPKDATVFCNRGGAWSDKKEYDKAIKDYTEAIRLDPQLCSRVWRPGVCVG